MALLVPLGGCKNLGRINYRVEVNDSYTYETSKPTLTPSAKQHFSRPWVIQGSQPARCTASRLRIKGRDLDYLNLNAVKEEQDRNSQKEEEKNARQFAWSNTVKDREKSPYELHHHNHHHSQAHHHTPEKVHPQHQQEQQQMEATKAHDDDGGTNKGHGNSPQLDSAVKSHFGENTKPRLQTASVGQYNDRLSTRKKLMI